MRKIIHNKVYDTDTAKLVGHWSASVAVSDFSWYAEDLYRKRTGEYFMYGEGGPNSKYAMWSHGMLCDGERIILLTYDEARQWAEGNLDADTYEAEFGAVAEDESRVCVSLSLSAAGLERARRAASARGVSLSAMVDEYFATL